MKIQVATYEYFRTTSTPGSQAMRLNLYATYCVQGTRRRRWYYVDVIKKTLIRLNSKVFGGEYFIKYGSETFLVLRMKIVNTLPVRLSAEIDTSILRILRQRMTEKRGKKAPAIIKF